MAAVHTEASAIFGGLLVNEAEDKIQYVNFRPSHPYDSWSSVTITILGNTSQYISLWDSYMFVQCNVEEMDEYGNLIEKITSKRSTVLVEEENEDIEGMVPNGGRSTRAVTTRGSKVKAMDEPMAQQVEDY